MKKQTMYFKMITASLMRRRSRMLVALLAVAIGATILSGLVTIYYDVPRQMGKEFRSYGANLLLLPSSEQIAELSLQKTLTVLPKEKVLGISPFRYETVTVHHQPFMIAGTDFSSLQKTSPYWYISGAWPARQGEILIGAQVATAINVKEGNSVRIQGTDSLGADFSQDVTVAGILQTGGGEEECIYISLAELDALMQNKDHIDIAECSISATSAELDELAAHINSAIPELTPRLVKRVTQSEGTVLKKLQSLVYIVTLVVLILTMVCVATTMMAVVAERRKEIGLRKALGASNKDIVYEFLGEGIFLGAFGGVLGVVLGFLFAQAVSINVFTRSISFQPLLVPITIIVSMLITGLACLIPVHNATTVDPVIVLRGE